MVEYSDQSNHWYIGDYQSNSGSTYKIIDNFLSKYLLDKIIFQLNQSDIHWKYNQTNDEDGLVSPLGENYY